MIVYKGFNPDMTCRGFQYKTNELFNAKGDPEICVNGFHSCVMPLDVLSYYPVCIYKAEVDISNIDKSASALTVDDSKICSKTIYITDKKVDDIIGEQEIVLSKIYNYLMKNQYKGFDTLMLTLRDKYSDTLMLALRGKYSASSYLSLTGSGNIRRSYVVHKAWFVLKMAYSCSKAVMHFDNFFEFAEDVMNTEVHHEKA